MSKTKTIPRMSAKKKPVLKQPSDYDIELEFAKGYLLGECELKDYPYYEAYKETVKKEREHGGGATLVIGSGPLPLTIYFLNKVFNPMDYRGSCGIDSSLKACAIGTNVLKLSGILQPLIGNYKAEEFANYCHYDTILITLEAGASLQKKKRILSNIHSQIFERSTVILRSSNTKQYVNANKIIDLTVWEVVTSFPIFNGLSTSYILKKK